MVTVGLSTASPPCTRSRHQVLGQRAKRATHAKEIVLGAEFVGSNGVLMDDHASAAAVLTLRGELLEQPGRDVLPRHLNQPEVGHLEDLGPGLVLGQGLLEPSQHLLLVVDGLHVDEVDDDDAADVPQPQLTSDLLGRLQIVLQNGVLQVRGADELSGVDVDDGQCLGPVDHQVATRREVDLPVEGLLDLVVDVVPLEERHLVLVELNLRHEIGCGSLQIVDDRLVRPGSSMRSLRKSAVKCSRITLMRRSGS